MTENPPSVGSGRWFRSRTDDELQYFIDGNPLGNRLHDGCEAELERRKAERANVIQRAWIKRTFWVALFTLVVSAIAAAASLAGLAT